MENKTGLIITLYGNFNFGNKLQNYALLQVLEKFGLSVHTANIAYKFESLIMNMKSFIKESLVKVFRPAIEKNREYKFIKFSSRYLKPTKEKYDTNSVQKITNYDFLIYGSDQIWNPSCLGNSNLFLGYSGAKNKNIAYAASFGISSLPEELRDRYCNGLNNFHHISVREEQGMEIIRRLNSHQEAEVVLDPTLLVTKETWSSLEKMPDAWNDSDYVLIYFLGEMSHDIENIICSFSRDHGFHVVNIMKKDSPYYAIGPEEFLYLEKNAKLVCTDSFHSCVFSFLYNTPFIVFDRVGVEDMSSRTETFLTKFQLEERKFSGRISQEHLLHNYAKGYDILEWERKKSLSFLKKALNIH